MQICTRLFTEPAAGLLTPCNMASVSAARRQRGVMLIEALVGIIIFSIGVLAVTGLQAVSIKTSIEAKNRTDAAMLANSIISQMSVDSKSLAALQASYNSPGGTVYTQWLTDVTNIMPGVSGVSAVQPTVAVTPAASAIGVTVTVFWQVPGQDVHNFTTSSQLNCTVTDEKNSVCVW